MIVPGITAHLQSVCGVLTATETLLQKVELQLWGLAIEHVYRLDAGLQHSCRPKEHALQVTCDFSGFVSQQLVSDAPHGYEELVYVHASINCDLASEVVVKLLGLDAVWSMVA